MSALCPTVYTILCFHLLVISLCKAAAVPSPCQTVMKPLHCFLFVCTFVLATIAEQNYFFMDPDESEAAYQILEAINGAVPWRILHPDNLCLFGPHGLNCDTDENNVLHIVEFSFGWVAENDNNAECGPNATISPSLGKLPFLRKLLFYRCFTGKEVEITQVIWGLGGSLQHLVFMQNSALVGGIPREIAEMVYLERLVMMENGLEGSIPAEMGSLKELNQLVLSGNKLTGKIPEELGSLQRLKVLDLNGNRLQGIIPVEISNLSKLQKLDLSSNELTGSMPWHTGDLVQLQLLDLSHNNLSGSVPRSLGRLSQLRILQLSSNNFSGQIPHGNIWSNLSLLVGLGLSNAGFHGTIPPSLGYLPHLRYLDLSGNKLEGTVPFTLGHLPLVYQMNLADNALVGMLPFSVEFVVKLGRNLQIKGNRGLCVSSDWPLLPNRRPTDTEGVRICDDEFLATASVKETSLMTEVISAGSRRHVDQSGLSFIMSCLGFVVAYVNCLL